jgi:hypothetical protein
VRERDARRGSGAHARSHVGEEPAHRGHVGRRRVAAHLGAVPSANTQSSARTHGRIAPWRSVCAPAAFVAAIPPTVAHVQLDGSTGKRSPAARAARSTAAPVTPGPHATRRPATSTAPNVASRERSTVTPSPTAPPAMLLPAPRGTSGVPVAAAHRASATTSSASAGTATARGSARATPAASL